MRHLLWMIAVLLISGSAYAQSGEVKGFQWGVAYKQEMGPGFMQASVNATGGYRFNRGNYLGLQSGYAFYGQGGDYEFGGQFGGQYWGIPLLADYIHYFPIGKAQRHSLIAGVEIGGNFRRYPDAVIERVRYAPSDVVTGPANSTLFYACVKTGLDLNIADFTHLQLALLFSYPGFGVSIGFAF